MRTVTTSRHLHSHVEIRRQAGHKEHLRTITLVHAQTQIDNYTSYTVLTLVVQRDEIGGFRHAKSQINHSNFRPLPVGVNPKIDLYTKSKRTFKSA